MTAQARANNGIPYICSSMLYDGWQDAFAMHHHLIGDTVKNIHERYRSWMDDCQNEYGEVDRSRLARRQMPMVDLWARIPESALELDDHRDENDSYLADYARKARGEAHIHYSTVRCNRSNYVPKYVPFNEF